VNRPQASNVNRPVKIFVGLALLVAVGASLTTLLPEQGSERVNEAEASAEAETRRASVGSAEISQQQDQPDDPVSAQESEAAQAARAARETSEAPEEISPQVGRSLTSIIELLNADNFVEARAQLDELMQADTMSAMSPYERSRLYQLSFNLNMQDEAFDAAQADLYAAIESGGLSEREVSQSEYQIAQLFIQQEDYAKAADSLEVWIARPGQTQNPAAYYLLAAAYYIQDKFDDARDHMETMMSMPGEKQEAWYSMMAALYLQGEDYAKAKPVVEKLVELFDDPTYREQLRGINEELGTAQ
jgi:tetratricopeptide (TPR) repeat protein